jgi:hypothetical protein
MDFLVKRPHLPRETEAKRQQEEIACLRTRWKQFNFPVQERLELLLRRYGPDAARIATEAVERK